MHPAAGGMHRLVISWYSANKRDLPWRDGRTSPWGVLVSEVMLQQTPVSRVLPRWTDWMDRWPTPAALAADEPGEAVRAWHRLGYPRRALRLHAAATAITQRHDGAVPADHADLLALPGIGSYTAAAVASFAFGQRHAVVDTNVRRVHARAVSGLALPSKSLTAKEMALAQDLLPMDSSASVTWNVGVMELGALVCTARAPRCGTCALQSTCAWVAAGAPAYDGPPRPGQKWNGTDRQVRGKVVALLRESLVPVPRHVVDKVWPDAAQLDRCVASLLHDGLIEPVPHNGEEALRLPR